mgnify:CR=1 FL=1
MLAVGAVLLIEAVGPKRVHSEHQLTSRYRLRVLARVPIAVRRGHRPRGLSPGDLRPFVARGGKLLIYQGWADMNVAPRSTVTVTASPTTSTRRSGRDFPPSRSSTMFSSRA